FGVIQVMGTFETEIESVPITKERRVPNDVDVLNNAGLPRANIAASRERPSGTEGRPGQMTVLQQHVEFFDRDRDGIIRPYDTYYGFRRLGFNPLFCLVAVFIIHPSFSYVTQTSWMPSLTFNINTNFIHNGKHGSDTESYDTEGRFVPEKFEEIFSKYSHQTQDALTFREIVTMIRGNANVMDFFGVFAMVFEWGTLWLLRARNGVLLKEDVRAQYDGSLFYKVERELKERESKD
ncbi:7159_t:CDS:2, partial [Paraglomus occultum]